MLPYETHLQLFHDNQGGPETLETYAVESKVHEIMSKNTAYPVDVSVIQDTHSLGTRVLAGFTQELKTLKFMGNPNSNKDVSGRIQVLGLGLQIPQTAKGNVSLPREWFDTHSNMHPFIDKVGGWRKVSKRLSTLDSILKNCSPDAVYGHMVSANWRTFAPTGSGRFVADSYPILQFPVEARAALKAPYNCSWVSIKLKEPVLRMLSQIAHDPTFELDVLSPDPVQAICRRLHLESYDPFDMFTEGDFSNLPNSLLDAMSKSYPILFKYVMGKLQIALQDLKVPQDFYGRVRSLRLDPVDSIDELRTKAIHAITHQNTTFKIKLIMFKLLRGVPALANSLWIPDKDRLFFTVENSLLAAWVYPSNVIELLTESSELEVKVYGNSLAEPA
jgi:hypothetical protein